MQGQQKRTLVIGVVIGAALASAGFLAAGLPQSSVTVSAARDQGAQVKVTSCAPGTVTMKLRITNTSAEVQSFGLEAYWFMGTKELLRVPVNSEAIPPGQTVEVPVGNASDSVDYQAGMSCGVKVISVL